MRPYISAYLGTYEYEKIMRTCEWLIDDFEACGKPCEGNTSTCASHGRISRKLVEQAERKAEKRKQTIQKANLKASVPRKAPNKVSEKRKGLNLEYAILRLQYLLDHPDCEVKLIGCEGMSVEIHHTYSGSNKVAHLNDTATWKATCPHCHRILHDKLSATEAREKGLKI